MAISSFFEVWFFFLGAAVGSFLNVVIFRIPRGFRVNLPSRSHCAVCRRKLRWFENVPVLGYLMLRGKCAGCQKKISPRYPLVESLGAILFLAVFRHFGIGFEALYYCLFAACLLAITFIDLDFRIIPDVISIPGTVVGLIGSGAVFGLGFKSSLIGALTGSGFFWALGKAYEKLTQREGLGFGDVKMLAMIGAFLGVKGAVGTIIISSFVGSIVGLILMVIQKKDLKLAIPYGPFLAIGALVFLFWGDSIGLRLYPGLYEL